MLSGFYICVLNPEKEGYEESRYIEQNLTHLCATYDIQLKKATDYHSVGRISEQVIKAIEESDIIFADANSTNENVWYEIGYSDKTNSQKVICLSLNTRTLPFDRSDIRSIKYEPELLQDTNITLGRMIKDIVCDQVIESVVTDTGAYTLTTRLSEKITRHFESEKLHPIGCEYLNNIVKDSKRSPNHRRLALASIKSLRAVTDEILLFSTQPLVVEPLKEEAFRIALDHSIKLPHKFWNQGLKSCEQSNFSLYMKSLISHWLNGNVDDAWFRTEIVNSKDDKIKQELLLALRDHGKKSNS